MFIRNNLNEVVEVKYYDRNHPGFPYATSIRPQGTTELERNYVGINLAELVAAGSITIQDDVLPDSNRKAILVKEVTENPKVPETPAEPEIQEETIITSASEEDVTEETSEETAPDFHCEICGKEFASARGLSTHMKSHDK